MTPRIQDMMTEHPVTIGTLTSLAEAARAMRDAELGDALVVDGCRLRGILTDRELAVRAVAEERNPADTTVQSVCSTEPVTIGPDEGLGRTVDLREHALRRLPVTDDGQLVVVVTLGDLIVERDPASALVAISTAEPDTRAHH
ncbi:CBS domain-containing protein [Streptomyces sp. NPDC059447]|uniref:CBS domain-containing protein n=1 Tax=Streptomyces sp. NPDC059447 TaxID=3346834 RepID=UPI003685EC98